MAKVIIHSLFEQKLHEYVEEAYEVYGRKTARRWMTEIDKIKSFWRSFQKEGRLLMVLLIFHTSCEALIS